MDQLNAMMVFTHVVDLGSFSKASQKLNMPLPTVSRKISDLEEHLGAQLLTRTTRKISLTESGYRYFEAAKRILSDVKEAELIASNEFIKPTGSLTITAPSTFGAMHVMPIVQDFLKDYPDVNIRLHLADQILHLLDEEIDLGLRIGPLRDSTMRARHLGDVHHIYCASPDYLKQFDDAPSLENLNSYDLISFSPLDRAQEWTFIDDAQQANLSITPRLVVNSAQAAVDSAINASGITGVLSYQASCAINEGKLVRLFEDYNQDPIPVHLVYPQGRHVPLKLRTFIDYATPRLKKVLQTIDQNCQNIS